MTPTTTTAPKTTGPNGSVATVASPIVAPDLPGNPPNLSTPDAPMAAPTTPDAPVQPDATPDAPATPDVEAEQKPDGDSDTPEVTEGPKASEDRMERLRLAREEDQALKVAIRDGLPHPPTPNLDQLHKEHDMRPTSAPKTKTTTRPAKVDPVPPAARRGWTFVQLRSDRHIDVVKAALKGKGLESTVVDMFLEVKNAEAQAVVTAMAEHATAVRKEIYAARLAVATLVNLRHEFPKAVDVKGGATTKAVNGLNAARESGAIDDWSTTMKLDGTLTWTVTVKGKGHDLGAREVAAKYAA